MPRYFFDFDLGEGAEIDSEGIDFADGKSAGDEAVSTLAQLALANLAGALHRSYTSRVRDENDTEIFKVSIEISSQWLVDPTFG